MTTQTFSSSSLCYVYGGPHSILKSICQHLLPCDGSKEDSSISKSSPHRLDFLRTGMGLITLGCKNNDQIRKELLKAETFPYLVELVSSRIKDYFFHLCGIQCVTCLIMFVSDGGEKKGSLDSIFESNLMNILSRALLEKTSLPVANQSERNAESIYYLITSLMMILSSNQKINVSKSKYYTVKTFSSILNSIVRLINRTFDKNIEQDDYFIEEDSLALSIDLFIVILEVEWMKGFYNWISIQKDILSSGIIDLLVSIGISAYKVIFEDSSNSFLIDNNKEEENRGIESNTTIYNYVHFWLITCLLVSKDIELSVLEKSSMAFIFYAAVDKGILNVAFKIFLAPTSSRVNQRERYRLLNSALTIIRYSFELLMVKNAEECRKFPLKNRLKNNVSHDNYNVNRKIKSKKSYLEDSRIEKSCFFRFSSSLLKFMRLHKILPRILWCFIHEDMKIQSNAVCIIEALFFPKAQIESQYQNNQNIWEMELIKKGCIPILLGLIVPLKESSSHSAQLLVNILIEKIRKRLWKDLSLVAYNDTSSHLSSSPKPSLIQYESIRFSIFRANICCAVLLLSIYFHNQNKWKNVDKLYAKQKFHKETIAFINYLIDPINLNSNDLQNIVILFKCIITVLRDNYLILDEAQRNIHSIFISKKIQNSSLFSESIEGKFRTGLKVWIHSPENPTKVKMECPPLQDIENIAPRLANSIKEQLMSNLELNLEDFTPNISASSYHVVEEFMDHLTSSNFEKILSSSAFYTDGFCLELLKLSHHFGSEALKATYSDICFKRMSKSNVLEIMDLATSVEGKWLSLKCFEFLMNLLSSDGENCSIDHTRLKYIIQSFLSNVFEWFF